MAQCVTLVFGGQSGRVRLCGSRVVVAEATKLFDARAIILSDGTPLAAQPDGYSVREFHPGQEVAITALEIEFPDEPETGDDSCPSASMEVWAPAALPWPDPELARVLSAGGMDPTLLVEFGDFARWILGGQGLRLLRLIAILH
eukprot:m51a1_g11144 hypothetical protein (144) ;mRNA; f:206894-207817